MVFRAETTAKLADLAAYLGERLGSSLIASEIVRGELTLGVMREDIVEVALLLRDDERCRFICFIDICGADYPERQERFDVVYHFLSPKLNRRIRVKVEVGENAPVPSIIDVYPGANWFEREAYDLYGVPFTGHPDMRRLLTDYGFEGHPLRKDFPLTGFVELRWDDVQKRVVYEPVKLTQEFRRFDFLSPWEGAQTLPGDEKAQPEAKTS